MEVSKHALSSEGLAICAVDMLAKQILENGLVLQAGDCSFIGRSADKDDGEEGVHKGQEATTSRRTAGKDAYSGAKGDDCGMIVGTGCSSTELVGSWFLERIHPHEWQHRHRHERRQARQRESRHERQRQREYHGQRGPTYSTCTSARTEALTFARMSARKIATHGHACQHDYKLESFEQRGIPLLEHRYEYRQERRYECLSGGTFGSKNLRSGNACVAALRYISWDRSDETDESISDIRGEVDRETTCRRSQVNGETCGSAAGT